jgi:hypothetical protein
MTKADSPWMNTSASRHVTLGELSLDRMRRQLSITSLRVTSAPQPGWMQATGTSRLHSASMPFKSRSAKAR